MRQAEAMGLLTNVIYIVSIILLTSHHFEAIEQLKRHLRQTK